MTKLPDSGKRAEFATGAVRDRAPGKGRFDLLSPKAENRMALRAEGGAIKYKDGRNWEKGMPWSEFVDSAKRHINQYLSGDNTEDHLAAAAWNICALMHMEETHPELCDIPTRMESQIFFADDAGSETYRQKQIKRWQDAISGGKE